MQQELTNDRLESEVGRGGFEPPTHGFPVHCANNTSHEKAETCENAKERLTPQLTRKSQKQGEISTSELPLELAEIVSLWPELPEHIKAAIKALIQTRTSGGKVDDRQTTSEENRR